MRYGRPHAQLAQAFGTAVARRIGQTKRAIRRHGHRKGGSSCRIVAFDHHFGVRKIKRRRDQIDHGRRRCDDQPAATAGNHVTDLTQIPVQSWGIITTELQPDSRERNLIANTLRSNAYQNPVSHAHPRCLYGARAAFDRSLIRSGNKYGRERQGRARSIGNFGRVRVHERIPLNKGQTERFGC